MIYHGSNPNQIALTYDDGPSSWTPLLLEVLKKHNVKATFFLLGHHAERFPEIVEQIDMDGHEIASHGYWHKCLGDVPEQEVREELELCRKFIGKTKYFRPPYGRIAPTPVDKIAESEGYEVVMWSLMCGDWAAPSTKSLVDTLSATLDAPDKGHIVLLHDGGPNGGEDRRRTVEAVSIILEKYQDREFVRISDLER